MGLGLLGLPILCCAASNAGVQVVSYLLADDSAMLRKQRTKISMSDPSSEQVSRENNEGARHHEKMIALIAAMLFSNQTCLPPWFTFISILWTTIIHVCIVEPLYYAGHVALHKVPRSNILHSVHHQAVLPTPRSSIRLDPLTRLGKEALLALPMAVTPGVTVGSAVLYHFVVAAYQAYLHGNTELTPPKSSSVWASACFHQAHHQKNDCNFGLFLTLFDKQFGTFNRGLTLRLHNAAYERQDESNIQYIWYASETRPRVWDARSIGSWLLRLIVCAKPGLAPSFAWNLLSEPHGKTGLRRSLACIGGTSLAQAVEAATKQQSHQHPDAKVIGVSSGLVSQLRPGALSSLASTEGRYITAGEQMTVEVVLDRLLSVVPPGAKIYQTGVECTIGNSICARLLQAGFSIVFFIPSSIDGKKILSSMTAHVKTGASVAMTTENWAKECLYLLLLSNDVPRISYSPALIGSYGRSGRLEGLPSVQLDALYPPGDWPQTTYSAAELGTIMMATDSGHNTWQKAKERGWRFGN